MEIRIKKNSIRNLPLPIAAVEWKGGKIRLIDQNRLPGNLRYIYCSNIRSLWQAIRMMKIRGAPAIGIAAALGVVLAARNSKTDDVKTFKEEIIGAIRYLSSSRPTARNLFWALERMQNKLVSSKHKDTNQIKKLLKDEAFKIIKEDRKTSLMMARYGASLIKDGDNILTHCNAGALATGGYGTALGVLFEAKRQKKRIKVYVDETRPLLQGARLTTWELKKVGIESILICDNMSASLMAAGRINKVFVGADRIARNGDTANKIGTYNLAVLASYHHIPFYVVAPISTFDFSLDSGRSIPIEQRSPKEVLEFNRRRIAPFGVKVYNPAFDITPYNLITAIITEKGIFKKRKGRFLRPIL